MRLLLSDGNYNGTIVYYDYILSMSKNKGLKNLEQLLRRISKAARDNEQISWGAIF